MSAWAAARPRPPESRCATPTIAGLDFDAIPMLEVLEHIEARTFAVLAARRKRLSPRGVMILSVPLREDLRRSYFICSHCGHAIHEIGPSRA